MRWLDGITDPTDMNLSELQEMVKDKKSWWSMGLQRLRHDLATKQEPGRLRWRQVGTVMLCIHCT